MQEIQKTQVQSPGSGRSPGEENGNPLHYTCLEISMDKGAWLVIVHGVTHMFCLNFAPEVQRAELMLFLSSWCVHIWRKGNYLWAPLHSLSLPREHHFCFILFTVCFVFF